jgi:hypothetical protein
MRPLKPFALRLGGLIAAVFGAVFIGAHAGTSPAAPAKGLLPDLQSKRIASDGITVSRLASADNEAPRSLPHFPFHGFSADETPQVAHVLHSARGAAAPERLSDQRLRLLVGVVELRI